MTNTESIRARSRAFISTITAFAMCALAKPAFGQVHSGPARAIDGDTLDLTGSRIRLFGIDAPEQAQTCQRSDGLPWPCGKEAAATLAQLTAGKAIECEQKDVDPYGRVVAICTADRDDLGAMLVGAGLAVSLPGFSDRYVETERAAKERRRGIWAGTFDMPADYRAAHPRDFAPPARNMAPARQTSPQWTPGAPLAPSRSDIYFRSCRDAWAAGYAPMRAGQPGYRVGLDGDGDGVACEPFRGR